MHLNAKAVAGLLLGVASFSLGAPGHASTLLNVQSYDMPNGGVGTWTYFDESYDGSGNVFTTGALLSGGTGDLTDGIVAPASWNVTEPPAGNGPYVG